MNNKIKCLGCGAIIFFIGAESLQICRECHYISSFHLLEQNYVEKFSRVLFTTSVSGAVGTTTTSGFNI